MKNENLMPFHESCLKSLEVIQKGTRNAAEQDDSVFITRFRLESRPIFQIMKMTVIPEKHLEEVIEKLKKFHQEFKEQPVIAKEGNLFEEEILVEAVDLVNKYFEETIESLSGRLEPVAEQAE